MERILSPDERIKRAEEIYYRKKMKNTNSKSAKLYVSEVKNFGMIRKMILQIIICILIYLIFYMIQNTNYIFSEDVIKKTNEILSYDINIKKIYEDSMKYINGFIESNKPIEKSNQQEVTNSENIDSENSANEASNIAQGENIGGEIIEEKKDEEKDISQMEKDAKDILASKSLIIPLKGTITSRYGHREPKTPTVPKNHTGIDIAVNEGTVFIASMSGTVKEVSSKRRFRKSYANCK